MSINFFCACGKRLRAREDMAGRRSMCPRCGAPVGIPRLQPTHRGAPAGPVTYAERVRSGQPFRQAALSQPEEVVVTSPVRARGRTASAGTNRRWQLDEIATPARTRTRKSDKSDRAEDEQEQRPVRRCPALPLKAWPVAASLGLLMTPVLGAAILVLPLLLNDGQPLRVACVAISILLPILAIPGYAVGFLNQVLASATGRGGSMPRLGLGSLAFPARHLLIWIVCFLAGPVYFLAAAVYYWLKCGDVGVIDALVLGELTVAASGYLIFELAAVAERGSLLDANPLQVAALMERLGRRSIIAVAIAGAMAIALARLGLAAAEELHNSGPTGWLYLAACSVGSMLLATALFRWLSVSCSRASVA